MRLILAISVLVLFFSCKKKDESDHPSIPVHGPCSGGKSYYYHSSDVARQKFRINSWWVYQDSVSLQNDSCYVSATGYEGFVEFGYCYDHQSYRYSLSHSLLNRTDTLLLIDEQIHMLKGSTTFFYITPFYSNFDKISYTGSPYTAYSPQNPDTIFKVDSMFIFDRYYKKVVISKAAHAPAEDSLRTIYYSNSDYGLLRKDVFNANGTLKNKWLLKNKNVIR